MEDAMAAWHGKVLCRGGEELRVEKAIDRFTVALSTVDALAQLKTKLNAEWLPLPLATGMVEFRVAPEQLEASMQLARTWTGVQFASHVYEMDCSPGVPIYLTNQITVQFAEATDVHRMRAIAYSLGLQVVQLIPGVPKAFVFEVMPQAKANPLKLAHQLMAHSQILLAEPNVAVPIQYASVLQQAETDAVLLSHQQQIRTARALTPGDRSIVVAIVAEAIDWQHPGLRGMGKIVAPLELAEGRQRVVGKALTDFQHVETSAETREVASSSTFSTLLTTLVNITPDCALMPIAGGRWLDDQWIEQLCQWTIDQGAAVLICGWEAAVAYFPLSLRQRVALSRAATQGRNGRGCLIVFAAGDDNRPVAGMAQQAEVSSQCSTPWLNGFAVHPDGIAVAACINQSRAAQSNWGTGIAVCAESHQGTAIASAIVAGGAALMLSVNPELTARAARQMLQDTADRIVVPDSQADAAEGQYDASGHSQWWGYGRVNVLRAVQTAWQRVKPIAIADRWLEGQNTSLLEIPDGDRRGVCSVIALEGKGRVKTIEVSLEIEHSLMGDLEISLIAPKGEVILLQNRTLGRITTLRKTYNFETTPLLKTLLDHPVSGEWRLQIIDYVVFHTGRLKRWQLKVGMGKEQS
jgi:subtilisin-like proprotein convertase family protein